MPSKKKFFEPRRDTYLRQTHSPLNAMAIVMPLLIVFHAGSAFSGQTSLLASRDLARVLSVFGSTAWFLPPLTVMGVLLLIYSARRKQWKFQLKVVAAMLLESVLWTLPLFAISYLCSRLLDASGVLTAGETACAFHDFLPAFGAGVYEEFLFRLILIGGVTWISTDIFSLKKDHVLLVMLVISSLAFSLYHFSWSFSQAAEVFTWNQFIWRAAAGLCLGIIYANRGFGITVATHTLWSLYCIW